MNRLVSFAASLLLIGSTGLALAQDATPTAGSPAPSGTPSMRVRNPKVKEIIDRIKLQRDRIAVGVKNGKLTADEATTLNEKLKSIGEEMRSDFKANKAAGQKGLTDDQIAQVNSELDANSTAIHDDKQDAAAPAASTTPAN
jgi:hypothetical protein